MKWLIPLLLLAAPAFGQQAAPIATPDQRLALEIAQLQLERAHLRTDLEKAKAEIEALKAKMEPETKQ